MSKERIDELVRIITESTKEIEEIRKECKHTSTHKGWYSWRVGSMEYGDLCDVCRKFIKADKIQPKCGNITFSDVPLKKKKK